MTAESADADTHQTFAEQVKALISTFKGLENLFDEESNDLSMLDIKNIVDKLIEDTMRSAERLCEEQTSGKYIKTSRRTSLKWSK